MEGMFYWCSKIQTLNVSFFDTSHVINMKSMFDYCSSLKKLDLSSFCTQHVIDFSSMFGECIQLEKLVLSGWDTRNADLDFKHPDREKCEYEFEHFADMQDQLILKMKESGLSMRQCFGF